MVNFQVQIAYNQLFRSSSSNLAVNDGKSETAETFFHIDTKERVLTERLQICPAGRRHKIYGNLGYFFLKRDFCRLGATAFGMSSCRFPDVLPTT